MFYVLNTQDKNVNIIFYKLKIPKNQKTFMKTVWQPTCAVFPWGCASPCARLTCEANFSLWSHWTEPQQVLALNLSRNTELKMRTWRATYTDGVKCNVLLLPFTFFARQMQRLCCVAQTRMRLHGTPARMWLACKSLMCRIRHLRSLTNNLQ